MIGWLKRIFAKRNPNGVIVDSLPVVTDWDVAQRAEQPESEVGRIEYRFLGVTGEEET